MPLQHGPSRMASATPTMQQRMKALGVATPLTLSSPVRRYVHCISDPPRVPNFLSKTKHSCFIPRITRKHRTEQENKKKKLTRKKQNIIPRSIVLRVQVLPCYPTHHFLVEYQLFIIRYFKFSLQNVYLIQCDVSFTIFFLTYLWFDFRWNTFREKAENVFDNLFFMRHEFYIYRQSKTIFFWLNSIIFRLNLIIFN